jgi:hypothetical protein
MRLKANPLAELARTIEDAVLPLFRKQPGVRRQMVLAVPAGTEAVAIRLCEKKEYAEGYHRETHPRLQKTLEKFIEAPPAIQTYKVVNSTSRPITAQAAVSSSAIGVR